MIDIAVQLVKGMLKPFSQEDADKLSKYREFQVLRAKIKGTKKERSYQQLKLYFGCCETVAKNTDDPKWNMKEKVDFQCRVITHFVDPNLIAVRPDGTVQFFYRSISFDNLEHIDACNYFDRAFDVMAKVLKITREELIENSEDKRG